MLDDFYKIIWFIFFEFSVNTYIYSGSDPSNGYFVVLFPPLLAILLFMILLLVLLILLIVGFLKKAPDAGLIWFIILKFYLLFDSLSCKSSITFDGEGQKLKSL